MNLQMYSVDLLLYAGLISLSTDFAYLYMFAFLIMLGSFVSSYMCVARPIDIYVTV